MSDLNNCEKLKDIELIKPFIIKANQFLQDEYKINVLSTNMTQLQNSVKMNNINFLTTLSGAMNSNLIFSFDKPLAKAVLDSYEYITYTDDTFEELLFEVVAEFLNLVVGRAMKDLPTSDKLNFSPPIEIIGDSKLFCNNQFNICKTDITTQKGNMTIVFSTQIDKE